MMGVKNRPWVLTVTLTSVVLVTGAVWLVWHQSDSWAAGFHQKHVTRSLRAWADEHGTITNLSSAIAAAEMIGYVGNFYVPGPGYRSTPEIESALEAQRAASISQIATALTGYTKLDHGTNIQLWTEWARTQRGLTNGVQYPNP